MLGVGVIVNLCPRPVLKQLENCSGFGVAHFAKRLAQSGQAFARAWGVDLENHIVSSATHLNAPVILKTPHYPFNTQATAKVCWCYQK